MDSGSYHPSKTKRMKYSRLYKHIGIMRVRQYEFINASYNITYRNTSKTGGKLCEG